MAKVGRPSKYTQELGAQICFELSQGKSLRTVCLNDWCPDGATIFRWLADNQTFREQYARATEERTEAHSEMLLEIGDDAIEAAHESDPKAANAVVSGFKLKADNIKWSMSKMKPKKYGDKIDMTTNGKDLPSPIYNGSFKK